MYEATFADIRAQGIIWGSMHVLKQLMTVGALSIHWHEVLHLKLLVQKISMN